MTPSIGGSCDPQVLGTQKRPLLPRFALRIETGAQNLMFTLVFISTVLP